MRQEGRSSKVVKLAASATFIRKVKSSEQILSCIPLAKTRSPITTREVGKVGNGGVSKNVRMESCC